jgi:hypothetical protein
MIIHGTNTGVGADVNQDRSLKVEIRPPAVGALGAYSLAMQSGSITATLGASSNLFSLRWTDSTRFALIRKVTVSALVLTTITTGVQFDLALFFARSFSASDTNANSSTTATLTTNNAKFRTSFGSSLIAASDVRMAGTGGFTAGTRTLDTNPLGRIPGWTGTAAGTPVYNTPYPVPIVDRTGAGQYPIVLAQNEGVVIQNATAGPATGTFNVTVNIEWQEAAAY